MHSGRFAIEIVLPNDVRAGSRHGSSAWMVDQRGNEIALQAGCDLEVWGFFTMMGELDEKVYPSPRLVVQNQSTEYDYVAPTIDAVRIPDAENAKWLAIP